MIRTNKDNAAIRRALTTLQKKGIELKTPKNEIDSLNKKDTITIVIVVEQGLLSPKKSVKKPYIRKAKKS